MAPDVLTLPDKSDNLTPLPHTDSVPPDRPAPHRRTLKRYDHRGHARYLTFSCFQRRPFLSRDRTREWFLEALATARARHQFQLWAWVIMPEHVHLLIRPHPDNDVVGPILRHIKHRVASIAIRHVRYQAPASLSMLADRSPQGATIYRFWQRGGGYDRNIFTAQETWEKINYIHNNPVRRELCTLPEEWPWSSSREYLNLGSTPIPIDFDSIPDLTR